MTHGNVYFALLFLLTVVFVVVLITSLMNVDDYDKTTLKADYYISFPSLIDIADIRPVEFEEYVYENDWYFKQEYWTSDTNVIFYIPNRFLEKFVDDITLCDWLNENDISSSRTNRTLLSCVGCDVLPVNDRTIGTILDHFEYWFVTNITFEHDLIGTRIFPIPIGIDFHTKVRREQITVREQEQYLKRLSVQSHRYVKNKTGVISDFHFNLTHPSRQEVYDALKDNSCVTFLPERVPRRQLWRIYTMNQFVCCPRGYGVDTHRIWEVLALHRYPIVLTSSLDPLYEQYPVVIVKRWKQVNKVNLVKWEKLLNENVVGCNRDKKLKLDYWISLIKNPQLVDNSVLAVYA